MIFTVFANIIYGYQHFKFYENILVTEDTKL